MPHLIYDDVDAAIAWLTHAFGFVERLAAHHVDPDGRTGRAQLEVGDGLITLGRPSIHGASPRQGVSAMLYVFIDDLDEHWARAQRAGATIVAAPHAHAGHRRYQVTDPEGHQWTFATEDPAPPPDPDGTSRSSGMTLDHVQIAAPEGCEAQARRFYGELLGLIEVQKPEPLRSRGGVWFETGDHQLHVGVEAVFSPAKKARPAFRVVPSELEAVARRMQDAGAPLRWDDELPDTRRFYAEDPWGNRVEILARP